MKKIKNLCRNAKSMCGATMVEYALLLALIGVVAIPAIRYMGFAPRGTFNGSKCVIADPSDSSNCVNLGRICASGNEGICEAMES